MKPFEDIYRTRWQHLVAQAELNLKGEDPFKEDAIIYYTAQHINYLEYHVAGLNRILENSIIRGLTKAEADAYIAEQINLERQLMESTK